MEKGFYLLQPEKVKYFEGLLEAMKALEEGGIWLCFPTKEKNEKGEMRLAPFTMWFDTIEKEEKFYVRMRVRGGDKKVVAENLLPSSKKTPKEFFVPLRNYLDQKLKKGKLTDAIFNNEELSEAIICYEEIHYQKNEAVELKNFDESSRLAEEEVKLITKIIEVTKKEICILPGFKWVTDNHILDILEV